MAGSIVHGTAVWAGPVGTLPPGWFDWTERPRWEPEPTRRGVLDRRVRTLLLRVERRKARRLRRHPPGRWTVIGATEQGWDLRGWVDEAQRLPEPVAIEWHFHDGPYVESMLVRPARPS